MQSNGTTLHAAYSNRLCVALGFHSLVLLHLLNELAGDVVDTYVLTFGRCDAVEHHAIADAVGCNTRLRTDSHRFSPLPGHGDLPIFGILNFQGTKIDQTHALAG